MLGTAHFRVVKRNILPKVSLAFGDSCAGLHSALSGMKIRAKHTNVKLNGDLSSLVILSHFYAPSSLTLYISRAVLKKGETFSKSVPTRNQGNQSRFTAKENYVGLK